MLKSEFKENLIKIIKNRLPNCRIYLYGSRARGDHSMGSDVDLALDAGQKIEPLTMIFIKEDIENSTIPYFVDVVDVHTISADFKQEITKEFVLLSE